ncbi:uncharacterized protein G6M90_00g053360 [Metarhizium brunneum]|uniref:Dickkopf N-terminal cysteine-rich domain-containing protein n=2 Tax=Metarhizium TaxID=5529 RepID=A0A0D9P4Y7_METAN|nr:hypothetical protein H634G_04134 [Metarhizium anisopliae BRIP 53293]KJK95898.1 hypothetical protein H633G_00247 [Metarhizium anisopliae BRIP 53284]QLI69968.1 hypothetical protein G6M90_00g053360 [Metarhizium brunneum]
MNFFQSKIILAAVAWLALASPAMACRTSSECPKGKICDQQRGSPTFGKCI